MDTQERRSFSPVEIAERNGLAKSTVYAEIAAGRLDVRKLGTRSIVTIEAESAWLNGLPRFDPILDGGKRGRPRKNPTPRSAAA